MRILVPLDGTPLAERALQPAMRLAQHAPGTVTLLLVRVNQHETPRDEMPILVLDQSMNALVYLMGIQQQVQSYRIASEMLLTPGAPAIEIARCAHQFRADLIVIASHIVTRLDSLIWGSVAETVMHLSSIPTLIVRPHGNVFPTTNDLSILAPLDGSAAAELAWLSALPFIRACAKRVILMQVLPDRRDDPSGGQLRAARSRTYLGRVSEQLTASGLSPEIEVLFGDPATQIATIAETRQIDLIVMSTHGWGEVTPPGSISEQVLHHVELPMLITHPAIP